MVLIGDGRSFIAGADIRGFGTGRKRAPIGERTYDVLDASPKPVVAAIHGFALGGGLENAMACHYRIAVPSAKVGLPEVLIGILPGGGGTQRLPRLAGAQTALEMITSGRHVPAPEAAKLGIIDEVLPDGANLREAAVAYARKIADIRPLPRVRDKTVTADPGIFDAMRKSIARKARNQKAPYHCIAAVEAACTLPFDHGIRREAELFAELETSDEAKALRYAFFAEREVAKLPDLPATRRAVRLHGARRDRRRHDGRRHRHVVRRFRLRREDHGRDAGSARSRHGAYPQQLRDLGQARQPRAKTRCSAACRASIRSPATTISRTATWSSKRCSSGWT